MRTVAAELRWLLTKENVARPMAVKNSGEVQSRISSPTDSRSPPYPCAARSAPTAKQQNDESAATHGLGWRAGLTPSSSARSTTGAS